MNFKERSLAYHGKIYLGMDNCSRTIQYGRIPENSTVLDSGCANGEFGEILYQEKNCLMHGWDYNPVSLENARCTNAYQELSLVDLTSFSASDFPHYFGFFDFIVLGDVLEHLPEPAKVLANLKNYLKPNGKFIISLPNLAHISIKLQLIHDEFNYTPTGLLDQTHIRFFTWKTLPQFFADLSMKIDWVNGTVKNTEGPLENDRFRHLPFRMRRMFFNDIHSWIFQYILEVSISDQPRESLAQTNFKSFKLTNDLLPWNIYEFHSRRHFFLRVCIPRLYKYWKR